MNNKMSSPAPFMMSTRGLAEAAEAAGEFITSPWPIVIACFCTLFVCVLTGSNVYSHLLFYSRPHLQNHIVRIIMVTPAYAVMSLLTLIVCAAAPA